MLEWYRHVTSQSVVQTQRRRSLLIGVLPMCNALRLCDESAFASALCAAKCRSKLRGAGHCTSAKGMTSILRHVAETFPPARQGPIVIGIANNTSMVLNCALVSYIMMTADVGLPDSL